MMTPTSNGRSVWTAAEFATFVRARAHVDMGSVLEPSILRDPFFIATFLVLLGPMLWGAWKIYTSSWIGSPWIWTTFVLAVFMFATSGMLPRNTPPLLDLCLRRSLRFHHNDHRLQPTSCLKRIYVHASSLEAVSSA